MSAAELNVILKPLDAEQMFDALKKNTTGAAFELNFYMKLPVFNMKKEVCDLRVLLNT